MDPRLPSVSLSWVATGDNGGSGGPAASYQIRYSKTPLNNVNFDTACDVSTLPHSAAVPQPGNPGAPQSYTVSGPDPRADGDPCKFVVSEAGETWYFGVRVLDDAGNQSLLVGISTGSTDQIQLSKSVVTFSDTFVADVLAGDAARRDSLTLVGDLVGDVDGDGHADMVVGSAASGMMCIIYGSPNTPASWTIDTKSQNAGLRHGCVEASDLNQPQLAGLTGLGGKTDGIGDVNGDGRPDFATSGKVGVNGVLLIYLGRNDGQPIALASPDVILLTGLSNGPPAYVSFCGAGNFFGGAVGAIGVGALTFANGLKVVAGDSNWAVGGNAVLDLGAPGGHDILTINANQPVFGWGAFCEGAGDVMATPGGGASASDLLFLRVAGNSDDPVYLIPGRPVSGQQTVTISLTDPAVPAGEDANILRLRQEAGNLRANFGGAGFFGADVTGDGVPDVVIAHQLRQSSEGGDGKSLYIFDGAVLQQTGGGTYLRVQTGNKIGLAWQGTNGTVLDAGLSGSWPTVAMAGNWNAWTSGGSPTTDLIHADSAGDGFLRLNHVSGSVGLGLFPHQDLTLTANGGLGPLGSWVAGGFDVDGDGMSDIISGTASGSIVIIR